MNFWMSVLWSQSIAIAAITGCWRFRKIDPVFRPFIYCVWLAFINETLSIVTAKLFHSNAVNSNIYVLLDALLIIWQFKKWGLFERYPKMFRGLLVLLLLVWLTENFFTIKPGPSGSLFNISWSFNLIHFSSWFRIFYSFITVLLSISLLNRLILGERGHLLRNPVALICLAFIIYYTYKVLVETFWVYGINENSIFRNKVYFLLDYINLFSNLIYALAILWMPTKQRFTMPYSSAVPL